MMQANIVTNGVTSAMSVAKKMHICDEETANTDLKHKFTVDVVETGSSFAAKKQKVPAKKLSPVFAASNLQQIYSTMQYSNGPLS